jgi:hypothetical protein
MTRKEIQIKLDWATDWRMHTEKDYVEAKKLFYFWKEKEEEYLKMLGDCEDE